MIEFFRGVTCGLIHRDLRPANIRVHRSAGEVRVGLIDFEHAMVGDLWFDLSRLHEELLSAWPSMADAFWEGYHPRVDSAERGRRLAAYDVLRHLRGIRFAHATNDAAFLAASVKQLRQACA
jgi:aminoglycoside phosphotransferase (APT) family kinase protein